VCRCHTSLRAVEGAISPTHAFGEREVCFGSVNAIHAEAPPPAHGLLNREMIYPFTNLLFGMWMLGNQGSEKRMMGFWDCHLEGQAIEQILNEAIGGTSCLKTLPPDSYWVAAHDNRP